MKTPAPAVVALILLLAASGCWWQPQDLACETDADCPFSLVCDPSRPHEATGLYSCAEPGTLDDDDSAPGDDGDDDDDDDDSTAPDDDDSATPEGPVQVVGTGFFDTIQEGVDAAPSGATLRVAAGCYDEAVVVTRPLHISGDSPSTTVLTGGGAETALGVLGVASGEVSFSSLQVLVPHDEPATLRAVGVVDSAEVLIHDAVIGFEAALTPNAESDLCARFGRPDQHTGDCDAGQLGIEVDGSSLVVSETDIACVGFSQATGGVGILAQADSELSVVRSRIDAVGSFAIRAADTALTVDDLGIAGVNRNSGAGDGEANGSAVLLEAGTGGAVIDDLVAEEGVFVGLLAESTPVTVSNSSFTGFDYGIHVPQEAASGQRLSIIDSTFLDLRTEAVNSEASTTILGSTFLIDTLVPPAAGDAPPTGVRLLGAGTVHEVSGSTFDGFGSFAIRFSGSDSDGNIGSVTAQGNTIMNVIAGNGIDVVWADGAEVQGNLIVGVDHAYNDEPTGAGSIINGYGIHCFHVDDCALEGNTVIGAEFAGYLLNASSFSSLDDTASGGLSRGFHIQNSQGSIANPTVLDQLGYGIIASDSVVQGTGGSVSDMARGPAIQDFDGVSDPLPGDLVYSQGGVSLFANGDDAAAFLSWTGGTFAGSASSAVTTSDALVELTDNTFANAGYTDENGYSPSAAIAIAGNDPQALTGQVFTDNVVYGGEGGFGLFVSDAGDLTFSGNTICAGDTSGVYLAGVDGALIEDNLIGTTDDPTETACDDLDWASGLHITQTDPLTPQAGVILRDLTIAAPQMSYGVYLNGLGVYTIEGVAIGDANQAGIYSAMALPAGLTSDADADGLAPYEGDCDDTNPVIGGLAAVEVAGDGLDNDCDGVTDDGQSDDDGDADGFSVADGDCDDTESSVNPGVLEEVGNLRDDNCDGWADLDGEYDWPELNIRGTTIDGAENGLWLVGATANLLGPLNTSDPVNTITNIGAVGVSVNSWEWPDTPLARAGAIDIDADTALGPTGSHCVSMISSDTSATLTGTTLTGCGGHGVDVTKQALVTLDGVDIAAPTLSGVYASAGLISATDLTVSGPGEAAVSVAGFESDVTVNDLVVLGGNIGVEQAAGVLVLGGFTSSGTTNSAVVIAGGTATLGGLNLLGAGRYGLEVSGGGVTVLGGSIGPVTDDGLHVSGAADVTATGLAVGSAGGHGLEVSGGAIDWTGGSITGPVEAGVLVSSGIAELEDVAVTNPGEAGLWVSGGTLQAVGGSVTGAGWEGVLGTGGTLSLDGVEISSAVDDGVRVEGTVSASVLDATLDDNGGFGLLCDGGAAEPVVSTVTLSPCEARLSGNLSGDFELINGCEIAASCTVLPL